MMGLAILFMNTFFPKMPRSKRLLHAVRYATVSLTETAYSRSSDSTYSCYYRTLALLRPLRCYAPPPLQREVTAKGHFLLPYTPPHLHMHTCVWLALTSMFTLVLRCYYVVIFAKCVRLFPCGRLRTCGTGL